MRYLLDSNILSYFYDEKSKYWKVINDQMLSRRESEFCVSILCHYELAYSLENASREEKERIEKLIKEVETNYPTLELTKPQAKQFGEIKKSLKETRKISSKNMKRHNIDIMLASTAIVEACILVRNDEIYNSISKLRNDFQFENWLA